MSELPSGWAKCFLEDCAEVLDSLRVPINNSERQQRIEGKTADQLYPYYGATGQVGLIDNFIFDEELVALGEDGVPFLDPMKPKAYMLYGKAWVNNHAHVLRGFNGVAANKFVLYYLNQFDYQGFVNGGTRLKLTQARMRAIPVTLPPVAEQIRIAQKLDELLAQVDTLKARINAIPTRLKRFRQSVLAAAVSGRLTEEWRSQNALPSPSPKKFEDLLRDKTKLSYGVLKPGSADEEGVPMVRVMDIGDWGRINNSEIFRISKTLSDEFKRTILEKGDILLSVMATIGRAAIVPDYLVGGNVNRALAVIKLGDDISPEFAFFQIMSPQFQAEFVEKQLGSAQKRINLSDLREFTVLLPVREEQTEIVHRVERLFAFADQLEAKFASAKSSIDHLTQSILAKAFRGELVPQDPNDEPASVLLERIQAQRAAAPKAKRGRKASA